MSPTLEPEDIVLVNRFSTPKLGDIVAAKDPRDGKILIKRVSKIKNNKYFVTGDNKKKSTDSRTFGWIKKKDIIGKVIFSRSKN